MIAIEKNTFLEFLPANLHHGTLSRSQSDSALYRSSGSSGSIYYFFNAHIGQFSITSMERTAQAGQDEVGVVVDAAKLHVDEFDSTHGGKMHSRYRQLRPDRNQRARFSEFVNEQKAKLRAQPHDFDIESVEIPTSLWRKGGVKKSLEQVKKTLHALQATLTTHTCL